MALTTLTQGMTTTIATTTTETAKNITSTMTQNDYKMFSEGWALLTTDMGSNIETVSHRAIQKSKRELNIQRATEYFWRDLRCLDSRWWNNVSSVLYIKITSETLRKINLSGSFCVIVVDVIRSCHHCLAKNNKKNKFRSLDMTCWR